MERWTDINQAPGALEGSLIFSEPFAPRGRCLPLGIQGIRESIGIAEIQAEMLVSAYVAV